MILNNYRKRIAAAFLAIFCMELGGPAIAAGNIPTWPGYGMLAHPITGNLPFLNVQRKYNQPSAPGHDLFIAGKPGIIDKHIIDGLAGAATDENYIDGPGQPEMKSFQSVNSDNMVDLFTGDFSYNIPLLDVGGYPVNLHYTSGITMDQEASWVGLGWNINPGTISRSMRGLPDDFDGVSDSLTRTQHIKPDKTTGVTVAPSLEIVGHPQDVSRVDLSARLGIFYNTYNGYGLETGVGIGGTGKTAFGSLTGNLSISNNSQTGITINPSVGVAFRMSEQNENLQGTLGVSTGYSSRTGISSLQIDGGVKTDNQKAKEQSDKSVFASTGANYPLATINFAKRAYTPSINMPLKNTAYSFTGKLGTAAGAHALTVAVTGYVNEQTIAEEDVVQRMPAAGYLYATNGNGRENVVMDFNREKDMSYVYKTTPHIAIPQYTYDAFSISGEGTGGSFRAYRGDVGYIFDHNVASRSKSTNGSVDVALGQTVHVGLEITRITTNTTNHRWNKQNNIEPNLAFRNADTTYEPVYFRNPGEKTINDAAYYRAIGGDSLIRIKLSGRKDHVFAENTFIKYNDEGRMDAELPVTGPLVKQQRDKRTQVISYLTAADASVLGLDKKIRSYSVSDTFPGQNCNIPYKEIERVGGMRKKNHLSEIDVLNSDGRRYVYGLPIYNAVQRDVNFSVGTPVMDSTGLITYEDADNTPQNDKGKDGYFSKEETPGYAHNFLLTGIVSPDYVDITGNGVSEDDPGDAVRFNYTEVYGETGNYYKWRIPFQDKKATYNDGFKTYERDNKATYLYGEKEMWYLHTIESKTMVAVFRISNSRQDAYGVMGENGSRNTGQSAWKLDSIQLYVKADVVKNGAKARPVKTVHLEYNNELCKNVQGDAGIGKLTLKKIWFTYNKNNKGKLNPYVFQYHPDGSGNPLADYNPSFNPRNSDRWGTFKSSNDNPAHMTNTDYPYTVQDGGKAARNASMWSLTDITLPSGGKMHVDYEADDYAYVQNKRAAQMTEIKGVEQYNSSKLYGDDKDRTEYYKIWFSADEALTSKDDLRSKYLDIDEVLYFKLAVTIPKTTPGNNIEMVPGYGTIEDYGIDPSNNKRFWVKLSQVEQSSPMVRSALQFLRLNLPHKAFPNSQDIDNLTLKNLVLMLGTSFSEIKNIVLGFNGSAKSRKWCQTVDLARSFARLSSPGLKKYGGGYRVKRITIYDNWNKMTTRGMTPGLRESVYGQEYNYTTSEKVNGVEKTISSGVATYEPAVGGEENPFRRPISYMEKMAPMAPVNFMFSEEPLGESYYPSPIVGYSKIRVRTINAKARSANGWAETEFYTSRDFPVKAEHTLLEEGNSKFKYETTSNLFRLNHKNYVTLSQGFRIELNDMNGKMKAQSTYAETDSIHPIAYSLNFYKVDDDKALVKHLNNEVWAIDSTTGTIDTVAQIGKDIEVMTDLREQASSAHTVGFSPNVDIVAPFIILPSKVNLPQKEEVRYRAAAVVKIVQRYGILDSVVVMDKGSVVSTKNMVYDAGTGNVVLSRTNNEFNDPVYNFNYPAYWAYSGMGQAYKNIGAIFQSSTTSLQLTRGLLYRNVTERYPVERFFESGDEVYVYNARLGTVNSADCRYLDPPYVNWSGRLWVINGDKGDEKSKGLYFIDSLGRTARDMMIGKMMIIRSGKRNMSDVSAGNVVMLDNPVKHLVDGRYQVVIDTNTRVLNASAATFKDKWKVENSGYQEDSCYTLFNKVRTDTFVSPPAFTYRSYYKHEYYNVGASEGAHFVASSIRRNTKGENWDQFNLRSVIKFNLLSVSQKPDVSVSSAVLKLKAQAPRKAMVGYNSDGYFSYFETKVKANYRFGAGLNSRPETNEAAIRRVLNEPLLSTAYNDVQTTETNKVTVPAAANETCVDRALTVTSLVSAMVAGTGNNHGFAIDLSQWGTGGESNRSERTQSYCSVSPASYYGKNQSVPSGPESLATPGDCIDCAGDSLIVTYSYSKDTCAKVCRDNIVDSATNPYRWGILGNWRMERSYVYYHPRTETDAAVKNSNIRLEGTLKDFNPYWAFNAEKLLPSTDSSRWVWNSAIEAFNRKGFEIENYDALGRYNAGLYGYNQTLPVAVAQNSRYRELLYDGFEDYGYKTNYCDTCTPEREFDFLKNNSGVDTTRAQSHTGLYSVHINSGSESLLTVPVVSDTLKTPVGLSAKIDSTEVNSLTVIGTGTGLKGDYYLRDLFCGHSNTLTFTRTDPVINFDWTSTPGTPGTVCPRTYSVNWAGTLQANHTGPYTFYLGYSGTVSFAIDGVNYYSNTNPTTTEITTRTVNLQAGHLYRIDINYNKQESRRYGEMKLSWSSPGQSREIIPMKFLYPLAPGSADTAGSVNYTLHHYCITGHTVQPKNVIRDKFSPLTNTKLTVSAWVRLDVDDCNATPALDSVIRVNFETAATSVWLKKTGVRIEGWQRYEANVDMPATTDILYIRLKTLADRNIYVDDIRVQPFNSSMKSFVYNPVNLRLMAELDENNYASFYEYDDDGTLIRVKKETERGILTVQETRSALFKE